MRVYVVGVCAYVRRTRYVFGIVSWSRLTRFDPEHVVGGPADVVINNAVAAVAAGNRETVCPYKKRAFLVPQEPRERRGRLLVIPSL